MKRKVYQKLKEWKIKSDGKTALLVDGARRIGKTFIVEEFARNEYDSYIKIDFSMITKQVYELFEEDRMNLDEFFRKLQILFDVKLCERKSVIIFDEVQLYSTARQMIKQLVNDGRYDYIETGSLISLRRNVKDILIPSEEEHLKMYPLDFEEFLWANDDYVTYDYIKECYSGMKQIGAAVHRKIMNKYREYMLVGGMPQSVESFVIDKEFENSERIKRNILELYRQDIDKFSGHDVTKVKNIFDFIPNQLQRSNKNFRYSVVNKNVRGRDYYDAFKFLDDSMMVHICYAVTDPSMAIELSIDENVKKCYLNDTGLLVTESIIGSPDNGNDVYKKILFDKLSINEGMYAENIVAQSLKCEGHKLYYYKKNDAKNSANNMEIDFVIIGKNGVNAVEVKSSIYKKHSSLDKFRQKFGKKINNAYILYDKDVRIIDGVKHLPIYMAGLL